MTDQPKRPWWRKKRWWAAGLLWLPLVYVFSIGPATYAVGRDWIPKSTYFNAYRPLRSLADGPPSQLPLARYVSFWARIAKDHRNKAAAAEGAGT